MRGLELFYLPGCPYCVKAKKALKELGESNADYAAVPVRWIDESEEVDYANSKDYYYVPTAYFGRQKLFEARPGDSYEEIRNGLRTALDKAVFEGPDRSGL